MNNDLIEMMIANKEFNDIVEDIIIKQNLFCDYNQLDVNKQLEIALKAFVIMQNKMKIDIEEYNNQMKESEEKYDISKFLNYDSGTYDCINSPFIAQLQSLPTVKYYNVLGQEVDVETYHGIVIHDGRQYLLR